MRPLVPLAVAVSLAIPGAAAAQSSTPMPGLPGSCQVPTIDDRCEAWSQVYNLSDDVQPSESETGLALSPDGQTAYVSVQQQTGGPYGPTRWFVLAYDAASGAERWRATYRGAADEDRPGAVAVSPDGRRVFVTGNTHTNDLDADMLTVAYDAATGEELWRAVRRGDQPFQNGRAIVVTPRGDAVYVLGVTSDHGQYGYLLTGYDPRTGARRFDFEWTRTGGRVGAVPFSLAMSPSGQYLYAAGYTDGTGNEYDLDFAVIGVRVKGHTARLAWARTWDGGQRGENDEAYDVAVDPSGDRVYATGRSRGTGTSASDYDAATLAFDAYGGKQLWVARSAGPVDGYSAAQAVAAQGGHVYVAAQFTGTGAREFDWGTVAYDATTGDAEWTQTMATPDWDGETPTDILATDRAVFVTGKSFEGHTNPLGANGDIQGIADQVTASYDPATGDQRWVARYNATGYDYDYGSGLAAAAGRLVVLGHRKYKGDTSGLPDGDVDGRYNYYDFGLTAYDDDAAVAPKVRNRRRRSAAGRATG